MKKIYIIILSILLLVLIGLTGYPYLNKAKTELEMSYPSFLDAAGNHQVKSVVYNVNGNTFKAVLDNEPDTIYIVPNPKTEDFIEYTDE